MFVSNGSPCFLDNQLGSFFLMNNFLLIWCRIELYPPSAPFIIPDLRVAGSQKEAEGGFSVIATSVRL